MPSIARLMHHPVLQTILEGLDARMPALVDLAIAIQQIPAPTFAEQSRADFVQQQFSALGLVDVVQDKLHNVLGRWPGHNQGKPVVVSAHLDTVFAAATDLTIRREGSFIYGPGIGDNSVGVAGLLMLAQMVKETGLRPRQDIWFVANVAEEGLGDLRGMKAVVQKFGRSAAAYLIIEGGVFGHVFHQAIAVKRYRIEISAPGGHSWGNFGTPSAIHLLGHLIAAIDQIQVAEKPRTTYNVGLIEGGTTINTIAAQASLSLDLRSEANHALADLLSQVQKVMAAVPIPKDVRLTMTPIGDRPAGIIPADHPLINLAEAALRQVGCDEIKYSSGSTDANIPLSQGLPAVCIGLAHSHNAHRLDEYLDTTHLPAGMKQLLLLTLAVAESF